MRSSKGDDPLDPRRDRKHPGGRAMRSARGTTPLDPLAATAMTPGRSRDEISKGDDPLLDPRRDRKDTREVAQMRSARGTTPLDPRRDRNDTREVAQTP